MQQQKEELHKPGNNGPPPGRSTPDDRHIIRMAQTPSPRNKMAYHEPVSPPETQQQQQQQQQQQHFYQPPAQITISAAAAANEQRNRQHQFVLDCYVKNRIVEAMRTTEDEKRGLEQQNHHKDKEDRGSPGEMVIDERPQSAGEKKEHPNMFQGRPGSQPHHQQFQTSTYAYPYSALNVSAGAPITISAMASAEALDSRPNTMMESKPLLSAKYEALSDED